MHDTPMNENLFFERPLSDFVNNTRESEKESDPGVDEHCMCGVCIFKQSLIECDYHKRERP